MLTYFDTSVLIKCYVMEPRSEEAIEAINQAGTGFPISHVTTLEITNALQLKVFRAEISSKANSKTIQTSNIQAFT
jgi:predicted nucleic acid-binding protein